MNHIAFIRRCLELAENGRGHTSPNPVVGCVIVKDGAVLTEGWHEAYGESHAELHALHKAAELAKGATLYVNLEPCCKAGKQPPCTEAILQMGIKQVVFGARDPNNSGARMLQKKGIEVAGPLLEAECRRQNRGFFSLIENGRPWVTLKKALRKDGSVPSECVTSDKQNEWSHMRLRAMHDAILVGSGTVIVDNPRLTTRYGNGSNPRRIILDPHDEIPKNAMVLTDEESDRTLVIKEKLSIEELLGRLKDGGIASVLVEGGPKVWAAFEQSGLIDEEVLLVGKNWRLSPQN